MYGDLLFGDVSFGDVTGTLKVKPPFRLLTDENIIQATSMGMLYFEIYLAYDWNNTSVTTVSTTDELNRFITYASTLKHPNRAWLMVPWLWCESIAMPTTLDDLTRIQQLFQADDKAIAPVGPN